MAKKKKEKEKEFLENEENLKEEAARALFGLCYGLAGDTVTCDG